MPPIEKAIIVKRLSGVEQDLAELEILAKEDLPVFSAGKGHQLAEYHLHHVLEGVFNMCSHINSRKPGGAGSSSYAEIARNFGKFGFIDPNFANTTLVAMAGYRNRVVHFYAQITPEELHKIIRNHLGEVRQVLDAIRQVLDNPDRFGLTVV